MSSRGLFYAFVGFIAIPTKILFLAILFIGMLDNAIALLSIVAGTKTLIQQILLSRAILAGVLNNVDKGTPRTEPKPQTHIESNKNGRQENSLNPPHSGIWNQKNDNNNNKLAVISFHTFQNEDE